MAAAMFEAGTTLNMKGRFHHWLQDYMFFAFAKEFVIQKHEHNYF